MINQTNKKTVFVETYGCQMNEYDTELVRSILSDAGFCFVGREEEADIVMLNTCSVRENAHRKVYGRIHSIRHNRRNSGNGPVLIGILGCMATNLRTELLENQNLKIDFITGPDSYKRLPQIIHEAQQDGHRPFDLTLSDLETYSDIFPRPKKGVGTFISVQRGCNNFCTFCVVPYTRGRERSRPPQNIIEEVRRLIDDGFKQVTLLGQNVNSYYHEKADFADLIDGVSRVRGIERIRFTSPNPKDFPDKLLDVIVSNPKVCKHIHLPLQSGNNRILSLMGRNYASEEFQNLVEKIRGKCPPMALTTDVIIGFSSETDAEFEDTMKVMKKVQFDAAFIFKYSERKGTVAERKFPDNVPPAVKTERIVHLNETQKKISLEKNQAHIGRSLEILIESKKADKSPGMAAGRTDGNKLTVFNHSGVSLGEKVKVRITGASPNTLKGVAM